MMAVTVLQAETEKGPWIFQLLRGGREGGVYIYILLVQQADIGQLS